MKFLSSMKLLAAAAVSTCLLVNSSVSGSLGVNRCQVAIINSKSFQCPQHWLDIINAVESSIPSIQRHAKRVCAAQISKVASEEVRTASPFVKNLAAKADESDFLLEDPITVSLLDGTRVKVMPELEVTERYDVEYRRLKCRVTSVDLSQVSKRESRMAVLKSSSSAPSAIDDSDDSEEDDSDETDDESTASVPISKKEEKERESRRHSLVKHFFDFMPSSHAHSRLPRVVIRSSPTTSSSSSKVENNKKAEEEEEEECGEDEECEEEDEDDDATKRARPSPVGQLARIHSFRFRG